MPYFCVDKIVRALNDREKALNGSRVAIIGVSYKPGVGDMRESPAVKVMRILRERGAVLSYNDDHVPELTDFELTSKSLEEILEDADVAVILTAHPGLDTEELVRRAPLIVDFRGVTRGIRAPNLARL
jgi:UDP-N-acetyl-D-glucosamine dehydrogenase